MGKKTTRAQKIQAHADRINRKLSRNKREDRPRILKEELEKLPESIRSLVRDSVTPAAVATDKEKLIVPTFWVGISFILLNLIVCCIYEEPSDHLLRSLRVLLSLGGSAFSVGITGAITVKGKISGWAIEGTGAIGVFLVLYYFNSPN